MHVLSRHHHWCRGPTATFSTIITDNPQLDIHYEPLRQVPYTDALAMQRFKQRELFQTCSNPTTPLTTTAATAAAAIHDGLLLLEHPSVYTLGRRSTLDNLRFDPNPSSSASVPPAHQPHQPPQPPDLVRVERGGEVTWHGPGQLVGYPIMNLARGNRKKDLHWFLRQIEQVIINVLADFQIVAERDAAGTGVWVGDEKIAAIGLSASKWITMHGFSINVHPDMECFQEIVPCGIEGRGVTSLRCLGRTATVDDVAQCVIQQFGLVFDHERNVTMHEKGYPSCEDMDLELFQTLPLHR